MAEPCGVCGAKLSGNVIKFGETRAHAACFRCSVCEEGLKGKTFFTGKKDGKLYCEPCHEETFSVKCPGCEKRIKSGSKSIKVLGARWHPRHVSCRVCESSLIGADGELLPLVDQGNGLPVCPKHKDNKDKGSKEKGSKDKDKKKRASRKRDSEEEEEPERKERKQKSPCAGCAEPISGRFLVALDRHWHPDHFVCATCAKPFPGGRFFAIDDRPYCEPHFNALQPAEEEEGEEEEDEGDFEPEICCACGEEITGRIIEPVDGHILHARCFNCAGCGGNLDQQEFVDRKLRFFHPACYQKTRSLPRCGKCAEPVDGRFTSALGESWHPGCFVCATCGLELGQGEEFRVEKGAVFCAADWAALFAPRCLECGRPVGQSYVSAMGAALHPECFECSVGHPLDSKEPFFVHLGKKFCGRHYEELILPSCGECGLVIVGKFVRASIDSNSSSSGGNSGEEEGLKSFHHECWESRKGRSPDELVEELEAKQTVEYPEEAEVALAELERVEAQARAEYEAAVRERQERRLAKKEKRRAKKELDKQDKQDKQDKEKKKDKKRKEEEEEEEDSDDDLPPPADEDDGEEEEEVEKKKKDKKKKKGSSKKHISDDDEEEEEEERRRHRRENSLRPPAMGHRAAKSEKQEKQEKESKRKKKVEEEDPESDAELLEKPPLSPSVLQVEEKPFFPPEKRRSEPTPEEFLRPIQVVDFTTPEDQATRGGLSLRELLTVPHYVHCLSWWMERQQTLENLTFLLEVRSYQDMAERAELLHQERMVAMRVIWDSYLNEGTATKSIPVSAEVRRITLDRIQASIAADRFDAHAFDASYAALFRLVVRESFREFVESRDFAQMREQPPLLESLLADRRRSYSFSICHEEESYAYLDGVVNRLISAAPPVCKNHRFHLKRFKNVVSGADLVNWILSAGLASQRLVAVSLGQRLKECSLLKPVVQGKGAKALLFSDSKELYRVRPAPKVKKGWPTIRALLRQKQVHYGVVLMKGIRYHRVWCVLSRDTLKLFCFRSNKGQTGHSAVNLKNARVKFFIAASADSGAEIEGMPAYMHVYPADGSEFVFLLDNAQSRRRWEYAVRACLLPVEREIGKY